MLWANFLITAWSNAVNLTDGLDGLATGVSLIVFGAYVIVCVWQSNQSCQHLSRPDRAATRRATRSTSPSSRPRSRARASASCGGTPAPAKIFMGDTGSLALGGALAGLSILSRTEILAAIIGGLFVLIVLSDVIQIGFFKMTGKRVFKMAPLHHHFELLRVGRGDDRHPVLDHRRPVRRRSGSGIFYAEWVAG